MVAVPVIGQSCSGYLGRLGKSPVNIYLCVEKGNGKVRQQQAMVIKIIYEVVKLNTESLEQLGIG